MFKTNTVASLNLPTGAGSANQEGLRIDTLGLLNENK
jgi:hypothetical protein